MKAFFFGEPVAILHLRAVERPAPAALDHPHADKHPTENALIRRKEDDDKLQYIVIQLDENSV